MILSIAFISNNDALTKHFIQELEHKWVFDRSEEGRSTADASQWRERERESERRET